jgi:hypothetical protein
MLHLMIVGANLKTFLSEKTFCSLNGFFLSVRDQKMKSKVGLPLAFTALWFVIEIPSLNLVVD